jgi:hypothetical protein
MAWEVKHGAIEFIRRYRVRSSRLWEIEWKRAVSWEEFKIALLNVARSRNGRFGAANAISIMGFHKVVLCSLSIHTFHEIVEPYSIFRFVFKMSTNSFLSGLDYFMYFVTKHFQSIFQTNSWLLPCFRTKRF